MQGRGTALFWRPLPGRNGGSSRCLGNYSPARPEDRGSVTTPRHAAGRCPLTPERRAQIEELFHRAECDPKQRAAMLEEDCRGDLELRQEVESLLSGEAGSGNLVRDAVRSELEGFGFSLIGKRVSHYRILDGLGAGGMG